MKTTTTLMRTLPARTPTSLTLLRVRRSVSPPICPWSTLRSRPRPLHAVHASSRPKRTAKVRARLLRWRLCATK